MCGSGGGRWALTSAFSGGGARRPGPERQLGVLRPPAFGLWPEARPRALAAVVDEQWGGGSAALGLWAPACGQWGPWATSPQRRHGLVTCAIYPCALAGPGQGQGYAGARVRVTFRWIGTAARSLDPILLHPGKELDTHIPGMSWKPRQKLCHIFTSIGVDGWNVLKPATLPF